MISYTLLIALAAALLSLLIAAFILYRDPHPLVHKIFSAGMVVLALETFFSGMSAMAAEPLDILTWQERRFWVASLAPLLWLAFGLSYARSDYRAILMRWKWPLAAALILPLGICIGFRDDLFEGLPVWLPETGWVIPLGRWGYYFSLIQLVACIVILLDLEKTLRGSRGIMRWQIKFTVLGLLAFFGARTFTLSQNILYRSVNPELTLVNSGALLFGGLLILRSLFRTRFFGAELYVSQNVLYNSLVLLIIGVYFIAVSLLAKLSLRWAGIHVLPLLSLFLLLALVGLAVLIFSDRLRRKTKLFISRNFHRPVYDYRKEWGRFTEATTSVKNVQDLCRVVTQLVSDILHFLNVSIWQVDESRGRLKLCASTAMTAQEAEGLRAFENAQKELIELMSREKDPVDLNSPTQSWSINLPEIDKGFLEKAGIRYAVALRAGEELIGIMTLGQRVADDLLNLEDFDLLKTIADQTAAGLNQLRLAEQVQQTREMEAFQTMSAFFIHDLKNVASRLSLSMQNLPIHFDNPEFRQDLLKTIGQSLEKINHLCGRLSALREKLEVRPVPGDLNRLVKKVIDGFEKPFKEMIVKDLKRLPEVPFDAEQISNVLTNLILNAREALAGKEGPAEIRVGTGLRNGWVELYVADNGPGMTREFMDRSLFLPFKTTKKQGMGIGLFQCKMIVEAHRGRIEVESEEGKGSTFRILLPIEIRR
jgi:putative PEP-CTERM system histidine kinase